MKRQLLCTFTTVNTLDLTVDYITTYFKISNSRLFTYSTDAPKSLVLVYNIEDQLRGGLAKNTILVHRKKDSNTVYTINALNTLIQEVNNGVLDTSFQVEWDLYKDKLLTVKQGELQISDLFFEKVIRI
jgi:hypothetical protein